MALLKANTGIGITNPSSALHVIGDGLFVGIVSATTFYGNLGGGVQGSVPYQSEINSTTFLSPGTAGQVLVTGGPGQNPYWSPAGSLSGSFSGITIKDEGTVVGSALSVSSLNFVGNNIVATASGAGATITLSNDAQYLTGTAPGSVISQSNGLNITGNLNISGSLSVGGTSVILNAATLQIKDKDIVLGITTNALNQDISTDLTATHGGIAIASTEGSPLINFPIEAGINSSPYTYKQLMWIRAGGYSGMGTDAWVSNYALSIGNTSTVANGSRLTVGTGFTVYDNLVYTRNIYSTGVITATQFVGSFIGNIAGIATYATSSGVATYATNAGISTNVIGGIASVTSLSVSGISTLGTVLISSGIITTTVGVVTYYGDGSKLTGITASSIVGVSSYATNAGIATYATSSGVSTSVIGGIASVTSLNVSGISTLGVTSTTNLTTQQLNVSGLSTFAGITTHTASLFGTSASFTGVVTALSFSGNASSATYANIAGISTYSNSAGIATYSNTSGFSTFSGYSNTSGISTYSNTSGIATNIKGGAGGSIPYQTAADTTALLANGTVGQLLQSNGGTSAPSWSSPTGLTIGYAATAGIATYATSSGIATNVIGGIGSLTQLQVTGISTFTNGPVLIGAATSTGTALQRLQVTGGAYISTSTGIGTTNPQSTLHVLGNVLVAAGSSTDQYITQKPYELSNGTLSWEGSAGQLFSITNNLTSGSIFSVNDISGIPSIDVDAGGAITLGSYGGNIGIGTTNPTSKLHVVGNVLVSGISTLGTVQVSSGIITATVGVVTYYGDGSKLTGITASSIVGVSSYATNAGIATNVIGGIGSLTQLQVTGISTFTNGPVLIGSATSTGTIGQILQISGVSSSVYIGGNLGIGTTTPTSKLHVVGDVLVSGIVTAITFIGNLTGTATTAGYATTAGISTNVIGGIGSLTQLQVTGISTFTNGPVLIGSATSTGTIEQILQVAGINSSVYIGGNLGIGTTTPTSKLTVQGDVLVSGVVTATTFIGNLTGTATTAGVATNLQGGSASQIPYQVSPGITSFIPNGTPGYLLKSNGTSAPTWVDPSTGFNVDTANYALKSGISTNVIGGIGSLTQLQVTGISTFTNGPVFVGAATSTGTASQPLQVTGGAYVSGNLGIGTTTPTVALSVVGNALVTGVITATTFIGNFTGTATTATTTTNVIGGIGSLTQLQVTGISTFTNGPVFVGAATSTGTASQPLQVTGGAYVSGNLGIGTTNPTQLLQVGAGLTQSMVVTGIGSVGIGTTNPTSKLEVVGEVRIVSAAATESEKINIKHYRDISYRQSLGVGVANNKGALSFEGTSTLTGIGTTTPLPVSLFAITNDVSENVFSVSSYKYFSGARDPVIDITTIGRLGIGITNPVTDFQINRQAYFVQSVGIGTSIPTTTIDVRGTASISGTTSIGATTTIRGDLLVTGATATSTEYVTLRPQTSGINTFAPARGGVSYDGDLDSNLNGGQLLTVLNDNTSLFVITKFAGLSSTRLAPTGQRNIDTVFQVTSGGNVGIGTSIPPYTLSVVSNFAKPTVGLSNAIADFTSSVNQYCQINIRNTLSGTSASSDIVVTTDTGTDTANFLDLGINNSGFNTSTWTINSALDGYLYTSDANLSIGAAGASKYVSIFTGGTLAANERLRVTGIGSVGIGTTNPTSTLHVIGDVRAGINSSQGVILTSPNGTKYRLLVSDLGVVSTVLVV